MKKVVLRYIEYKTGLLFHDKEITSIGISHDEPASITTMRGNISKGIIANSHAIVLLSSTYDNNEVPKRLLIDKYIYNAISTDSVIHTGKEVYNYIRSCRNAYVTSRKLNVDIGGTIHPVIVKMGASTISKISRSDESTISNYKKYLQIIRSVDIRHGLVMLHSGLNGEHSVNSMYDIARLIHNDIISNMSWYCRYIYKAHMYFTRMDFILRRV